MQRGAWWCTSHAICVLRDVRPGAHARANLEQWTHQYRHALSVLQKRASEAALGRATQDELAMAEARLAGLEETQMIQEAEEARQRELAIGTTLQARAEVHGVEQKPPQK